MILGTHFEKDITKDVELLLNYDFNARLDDFSNNFHHAIATLSIDITEYVELDISFVWDRVGNPEPGADGVTPEQDDFNLTIGLGFEL